ncbi:endonuclease/exonuclease/phosphatase family protein [Actinoplanes solisilvae]|uniref:endonuclease/exonuclease/phosphatase family protein n=1 Tax=Actinoplanes solisilvae TaxID=2486853 RepID=UPI000FDA9F4A|nr:endonuclease/exonuclease/phosphatase family protein [Actinoplanes solisilvae]
MTVAREVEGRPRREKRARTPLPWLVVAPGLVWGVLRVTGAQVDAATQLIAFTPYAALWSVLLFLLALTFRRWWAAVVAALAAGLLLGAVTPRAIGAGDRGPRDGVTLPVMSANLRAGGADPATVVRLVRDNHVGVLALQEFTRESRAALTAAGLDVLLPYASLASADPRDDTGSALYSRYPISDAGSRLNRGGFRQAYGQIQPSGAGPLLVESVHTLAPASRARVDGWQRDLADQPVPDPGAPPQVLLGDFNATLDHRPFRDLVERGYRDVADTVGGGLRPTWGPFGIQPLRLLTLDHVLADRRIGVVSLSVRDLANSDHRALLATLRIPAPGAS